MNTTKLPGGNAILVSLPREMLMSHTPTYRAALLEQMDDAIDHLLLDLSNVEYMDSSGLSVLVSLHKRARELGGEIILLAPSDGVRALIELTSLHHLFKIYQDVQTAIKQFSLRTAV